MEEIQTQKRTKKKEGDRPLTLFAFSKCARRTQIGHRPRSRSHLRYTQQQCTSMRGRRRSRLISFDCGSAARDRAIARFLEPTGQRSPWSTKLRKMQFYKSVFYQKNEALLFITTLPCLKVFASLITKNIQKFVAHRKVCQKSSERKNHQEECVQSAKTARCVAPCVPSQVLQVTDELPSFPSKAEFSQIEG